MSTAIATQKWNAQHQNSGIVDWTGHYFRTRGQPSRCVVIEALKNIPEPWTTLVELGCNAGPMLADIHEAFPGATLTGVETNPKAVDACRGHLPEATIVHGDLMRWLPQQHPKSYDVLVSHYTFAYVAPVDLAAVLFQCRRVATWMVLAEPTATETERAGLIRAYPEWRHDYITEFFKQGIRRVLQHPVEPQHSNVNVVLVAHETA